MRKLALSVLMMLGLSLPVKAQILHVQSTSTDCGGGSVTTCGLAFSSSNVAGNLIVVAVRTGSTTATVTVTDSQTNTYTQQISQNQTTDGHKLSVVYAANIKAGTNTVTVTTSASVTVHMAIHEYSGIVPVSPVDQSASTTGSSATPNSGNVSTTQVSELLFGAGASGGTPTWNAGSGYTLRQVPSGNKLATEDQVASLAGAYAGSFSLSVSNNWSAAIVAFKGQPAYPSIANTFTSQQNFNADVQFKGPNPYVDIRAYGARALTSSTAIPAVWSAGTGINGTINASSTSLAVSTNSCSSQAGNVCFVNGDGIVVVGAGPAETMTTPVILSVTPSTPSGPDGTNTVVTGPTGGTTYNYKLVSVDKGRGMTVASATVSTTVGQASLGKQTVGITSCARAGVTVTCLTAASHTLAVNTLIYIGQISDGTFAGWYRVATVPDNTHFTYTSGFDTASGATISSTGGTLVWKNENFIQWVHPPTGAAPQQYIICSDRAGGGFVPIGISKVDNTPTFGGNDLALGFDDLGSPMMDNFVLPYWAGTNPCTAGSPQADELVTTIASGAGTTTLTLAAAASTSVTNQAVLFDNAPNFITAATASRTGPLNIPMLNIGAGGAFVFNSYMVLPSFTNVCQVGNIAVNDTIEFNGSVNARWSGKCPPANGSIQSFAWDSHATVSVGPAYPGFYSRAGDQNIDSLNFVSVSGNQKVLLMEDPGGVPSGSLADLNFNTTATGDYTGMGLFLRVAGVNSPSNLIMSGKFGFIGGSGDGTNGNTTAPLFYSEGGVVLENISFAKRGLAFKSGSSGQGRELIKNIYMNGGVTPMVMFVTGGTSLGFTFGQVVGDTVPLPFFVNLVSGATAPLVVTDFVTGASFDGTSIPPNVSGFSLPIVGVPIPQGWTNAITGGNFTNNQIEVNGTVGEVGYALSVPAAPVSCNVTAGGSVPIAANIPYAIVAIDANGNFSPAGPPCLATTSSGQQTVTIVPPSRPSGAVTYQVVRAASQQFVAVAATRWTSNIVDTFGFTNGPIPNSNGQQAGVNTTNILAPQLVLTGGGFKNTHTFTGTADRTTTWPDSNGTVMIIPSVACTNGELALSAGWQSTGSATVTAVAGIGYTCSWTITTGTTTAANPTITDTLTVPLISALVVCELNIHGGTHTPAAGEGFQQTTLSATAPVFTFNGTPTAGGKTYFVTRRCGP